MKTSRGILVDALGLNLRMVRMEITISMNEPVSRYQPYWWALPK